MTEDQRFDSAPPRGSAPSTSEQDEISGYLAHHGTYAPGPEYVRPPRLATSTQNAAWPYNCPVERREDCGTFAKPEDLFIHCEQRHISWQARYPWSLRRQERVLLWAAWNGYAAVVKLLLLEEGINLESRDGRKMTPLICAAYQGNTTVVALLLEDGADLESRDIHLRTPLAWAACGGYKTTVRLLLEKGADMESRDYRSRTPLQLATPNRCKDILLERAAHLRALRKRSKTAPGSH